jgi:hypothetical protein
MSSIPSKPALPSTPASIPAAKTAQSAAAGAVAGAVGAAATAAANAASLTLQENSLKAPAKDSLTQNASGSIQESQLRGAIKTIVQNNEPNDVNELKDLLLDKSDQIFGADSPESKKIFTKLFEETESVKKYDSMLGDALKEFKNISKDPAKAEAALKKLSEFVAKGARGLANGEDDPGC